MRITGLRSQKGQATVELALSIVLLMFIVFGIVDFGRIFHAYLVLDHAGREAAREASVGKTDIEIKQSALTAAPSLDSDLFSISVSPDLANRKRGEYATVTLDYSVDVSTPLLAEIIPNPFKIESKTVMRVE
ncbi:TadE/TadG family type IV pilus assembly protein [Pseudalkalibacillus caeni]|uniref:Pilus assembly protein n=1 Tax=Exobacillus caeni TaxID=2574798 RepID=A0A5R9F518_9BACL|nr:TadE family protein [Pseudalkalibacillus caeni]TLS35574.1 pilus assembly protein [Pseudalkalibacillus caeni]